MFEDLRREVGEAISKVCKMEGVTIIKVFFYHKKSYNPK